MKPSNSDAWRIHTAHDDLPTSDGNRISAIEHCRCQHQDGSVNEESKS